MNLRKREGSDDVSASVSYLISLCQKHVEVFESLTTFLLDILTVLKFLNLPCLASSLCLHCFLVSSLESVDHLLMVIFAGNFSKPKTFSFLWNVVSPILCN